MRKQLANAMVAVVAVSVVSITSGCGMKILPDRVTITTAEGEKAYQDGENAKQSETLGLAYMGMRAAEEKEITQRGTCNYIAALAGMCTAPGGS